jgi:hypothetical protein
MKQLLIVLFMLLTLATSSGSSVKAQEITSSSQWNWDSLSCFSEKRCSLRTEIDYDGTLYLMQSSDNVPGQKLMILKNDGSPAVEIDVSHITQSIESDGRWYYIPFEDGTMAFSTPTINGYRIFKYNINTDEVSAITLEGGPIPCNDIPTFRAKAMYRIGRGHTFIACSVKDDRVMINIYNLDTNTATVIPMYEYDRVYGAYLPLQGGADGTLYDQTNSIIEGVFEHVRRYPSDLKQWQMIRILKDWLTVLPPDSREGETYVLGGDETGHLYYVREWRDSERKTHLDLLKITAEGELVWHITEVDLGEYNFLHTVLPDGSIFAFNTADFEQMALLRIENK